MTRTTIMLSPKLKARVLQMARREGISMGELIRDSLERRLSAGVQGAPDAFFSDDFAAKGSGSTDVAENHDVYLAEVVEEKMNGGGRRVSRRRPRARK